MCIFEGIVLTCEKYADVLDAFLFLVSKYWTDHPKLVIVFDSVPERKWSYQDNVIFVGGGENYSDRIKAGLSKIQTDQVLFLMDDYFLFKRIDTERLALLAKQKKDYIRFSKDPLVHGKKEGHLQRLPFTHKCYEVNCAPSLWNKQVLLSLLDGESTPWQLEIAFDKKCSQKHYVCYKHTSPKRIFAYKHGAIKGKYFYGIKRFLKREGFSGELRDQGSFFNLVAYNSIILCKRVLPRKLVEFIKRISGKHFISDDA